MPQTKPFLSVRSLSHTYHTNSGETPALRDIHFDLFPGEFAAIVGPSGCGKSTLGRTLLCLNEPTEGEILFHGTDLAKLKKKEYKEKISKRKYPSIAYELAEQIQEATDKEVRITVPGHTQRGGSPCAYDRVFATRVGAKAAEMILEGKYGYMVAMRDGETTAVPLEEVAGKLKMVDPKCGLIKEAKTIGISFGDE